MNANTTSTAALRARWQALAPREQTLVLAAAGVVGLALLWWVALAPALAVWSLGPSHENFHTFFLMAAGLALAGGLAILPIRGVR